MRILCLASIALFALHASGGTVNDFTLNAGNFRYSEKNLMDAPNSTDVRLGTSGGLTQFGKWDGTSLAPNQMHQNWWWYRITDPNPTPAADYSDKREYAVSNQTSATVGADFANLTYEQRSNTPGPNPRDYVVRIQLNYNLVALTATRAQLQINWTIQNIGQKSVGIDLFAYFDPDLRNTTANDKGAYSLESGVIPTITAKDGDTTMKFSASRLDPTVGLVFKNWEMGDAYGLRNKLADDNKDNLTNAATPFAGDDLTGGFQWGADHLGPGTDGNGMFISGTLTKELEIPAPGALCLAAGSTLFGIRRRR